MRSRSRKRKPVRRPRGTGNKRAPLTERIPFPIALPGMRVGLFGGTFNPPHDAHRAASLLALKRLGLDRVWWLVTPGNPLKDNHALPPLAKRIEMSRKAMAHPAVEVTGIEAALHTHFTADTVAKLKARYPHVHFVFVIGADNLAGFHRWKNWRALANMIPIAVIDRPDYDLSALSTPAASALARARIDESDAPLLPLLRPPVWVFLHGLKSELSSTALRAARTAKKRKG
ncbi:MAG TPA: nicotinate-nucleotide adenylyltransferase [Xanthobacteraceae bacterium]|nr:nicotinate-nucleotide adenylyltransferase [Xanthobacteraceae bacterium]